MRTPTDARSTFLGLCWAYVAPNLGTVKITPRAAKYLMDLTEGHVIPEMCEVAGISVSNLATDNLYLALCGRKTQLAQAEQLIEAAIEFTRTFR